MDARHDTGISGLAEFIRRHQWDILEDWQAEVRRLPAARQLPRPVLIDALPDLLVEIAKLAEDIAAGQPALLPQHVAERHAFSRLDTNFDLCEVIWEYSILRKCLLRRWERETAPPDTAAGRVVLDEALDRALVASVERYTLARNRTLEALDRVSTAALEAGTLDALLERLLRVLLETTEAVDTATILLREGDELRVRASVGLEQESAQRFRVAVGEGFAGRIAAENKPLLLSNAATDPLVKSQAIRDKGIQALYGIPLVDAGRVIGVVHMGSLTAPDFSDQDKRLLAALGNRVTVAIVQHMLQQEARTRARQQEAVAALGQRSLGRRELQELLDDAVTVVSETLGTEMSKVLELLPDGRALLLRAGVGWTADLVGRATVSAGTESQAGYTLLSDDPVIVDDLGSESRFSGPPLLRDHGVVSGMSVIIRAPGQDGRPYGVFGTHTRQRRTFTRDDVNFLQAVANIVGAALARVRAERELRDEVAKFHDIATHLREALWITDPEVTRFDYVSPAYEQLWGRSVASLYANPRSFLDGIVPEDRARVEAALPRLREGTYDIEYRVHRPDDTTVWVHARGFPVKDARGEVIRTVGLSEDITPRKQADLGRNQLLHRERAAREEAEAARAQIATILERMTDAFLAVDRDWRIIHINAAGERIARQVFRIEGAVLGRVLWDAVPEAIGTPFERAYRKAMDEQVPLHFEEFLAPVNAWFEVRVFPSGEGLSFFFFDVTERRRTEEALRFLAQASATLAETLDYEATLRSVAQLAVPTIAEFCLIDLVEEDGTMKRVAAHANVLGGDILERARKFPPEIRDERLFIVQAFRSGQPRVHNDMTAEWRRAHVAISDEHDRFLESIGVRSLMALPLVAFGRTFGVMTFAAIAETARRFTSRDVELAAEVATRAALAVQNARLYRAARDAQARSDEAARRLRFLAEASRELAASLDYATTFKTIAQLAAPAVADWCVVDLITADGSLVRAAVHHRDPARIQLADELRRRYPPQPSDPAGASRVMRTGATEFVPLIPGSLIEAAGRDADHRRILHGLGLTSYICVPLMAGGRILGAITFVTEGARRLTEDDLSTAEELARRAALAIENARLYDNAQRAARAREEVLGIVTHDLRNPLGAVVMGAAGLVRVAPPDEPGRAVRKYAETIHRSAQRMSRLIDDLTDIGNIDAGRLSIERAPEDPCPIVSDVVESFGAAAAERGTAVRYECIGELAVINCDRERLVQALSNIVGNAVNVTLGGAVTVRVEARDGEVVFSVSDSGPGIAPEDLPHVFERHWRSKTAPYKGTGLGLAIAKGIVDAHGGRVWVESQIGAGSTFYVALPR